MTNEPHSEKTSLVFPIDLIVTNKTAQQQKMARGLKFWILEEEILYYLCSENQGADKLLVCGFVFTYAKKQVFS